MVRQPEQAGMFGGKREFPVIVLRAIVETHTAATSSCWRAQWSAVTESMPPEQSTTTFIARQTGSTAQERKAFCRVRRTSERGQKGVVDDMGPTGGAKSANLSALW